MRQSSAGLGFKPRKAHRKDAKSAKISSANGLETFRKTKWIFIRGDSRMKFLRSLRPWRVDGENEF
jgi:hypothetical protein